MGKKLEDYDKKVVYVLFALIALFTIAWIYGMSYIFASVVGLFLGKEVTTLMGLYILAVISYVSILFSSSE